jgi:hypothetical protein
MLRGMGRPTTRVYEVSAPDGEVLGLARASSAGQALRRINELCGVPCTVLGRRVFFAEPHRRDCAGRWQVRSVRLAGKAANLMTRNYVAEGPPAVFVAHPPRRAAPPLPPALRARSRPSCVGAFAGFEDVEELAKGMPERFDAGSNGRFEAAS